MKCCLGISDDFARYLIHNYNNSIQITINAKIWAGGHKVYLFFGVQLWSVLYHPIEIIMEIFTITIHSLFMKIFISDDKLARWIWINLIELFQICVRLYISSGPDVGWNLMCFLSWFNGIGNGVLQPMEQFSHYRYQY